MSTSMKRLYGLAAVAGFLFTSTPVLADIDLEIEAEEAIADAEGAQAEAEEAARRQREIESRERKRKGEASSAIRSARNTKRQAELRMKKSNQEVNRLRGEIVNLEKTDRSGEKRRGPSSRGDCKGSSSRR